MSTARSLLSVVGGRAGLVAFWFVGNLVIIRVLGPSEYGVYALCVAAIKVLAGVLGDPLDLAVLREVPLHLSADRPRALAVLRAVFWMRGLAGTGIVALAMLGALLMVERGLDPSARAPVIILTAAGVAGELLLRHASNYFQAAERFARYLALEACLHVGRLAAVLAVLAVGGELTAGAALVIYAGAPYAVLALACGLLPGDVRRPGWTGFRAMAGVTRYFTWTVVGFGLAALFDRVDIFLLGYFAGPAAVGVYAAALTLATLPDFVTGSLGTVLNPRIMPAYARGEFPAFVRRYSRYAVPVGVLALAGALGLGGIVIEAFLSTKYASAVPLFRVLVVGTIVWAVVTPLPAGLLAMLAPRRVVTLSTVGLVLSVLGGLALIPPWGAAGAAILFVAVRVGQGAFIVRLVHRILAEGPPVSSAVAGPALAPRYAAAGWPESLR